MCMYNIEEEARLKELCNESPELNQLISSLTSENKFLISRITHEIRNPLTLIFSTLQLIQSKNSSLASMPYWHSIMEDMKDLFLLLEQLSNYNQSDVLTSEPTDLGKLLMDLVVSFHSVAQLNENTLTVKLLDGSHPYIDNYTCDYIKLKQVFTNIIKNAIEAVDKKGHITITAFPPKQTPKGAYLIISIANDGPPIESDDMSNIFTPFITTKAGGTGLGLATANRIVISHGGYIEVVSDKTGTEFSIHLPLACI